MGKIIKRVITSVQRERKRYLITVTSQNDELSRRLGLLVIDDQVVVPIDVRIRLLENLHFS